MAKVRSRKSRQKSRLTESEMRKVVKEIGAQFSDTSLRRLIAAIQNNRPIVPPDDEGWDIGAMLLLPWYSPFGSQHGRKKSPPGENLESEDPAGGASDQ
jgi:hypothetical protein